MMVLAKQKICVEGLNLCFELKNLTDMGYCLFDIVFVDKKHVVFCVNMKDCKKVVAYLTKKCYNTKIVKNIGWGGIVFGLSKHWIAMAIVIVFCSLCLWLGNVCLDVEIIADKSIFDEVCQAVDESGIKKGRLLRDFKLDETENFLCVKLPQIKYALIEVDGCRVVVRALKKEEVDQPVDLSQPKDIVAECDGVVTRILVVNGTAVVSVGDRVKKGQVLIEGKNTFFDGSVQDATALGSVWARAESVGTVLFCESVIETMPTGSVTKRHCLKLGAFESKFNKPNNYSLFDIEESVKRLFPLGIEVLYQTVYEMKVVKKALSLEEQLPNLQAKAYDNAIRQAPFDVTNIVDTAFGTVTQDGNLFVTATVYADIKISN